MSEHEQGARAAGTPPEVLPALTERDWRTLRLWKAGKMPGGHVRGMVVLDLPESHIHGAAACALYGEPFGFQRLDVEILRQIAPFVVGSSIAQPDLRAWAHGLAARIGALLPPDDRAAGTSGGVSGPQRPHGEFRDTEER
jgi:hypothetical protein